MKRIYTLLIVLFSLTLLPKAEASHIIGGEINWECLNDGRYVFKMKVYRDCSGAPWGFSNETLQVFGNPLPTNIKNQLVTSIALLPDSARWLQRNNGDISPTCSSNTPQLQLNCDNNNANYRGAVQAFFYKSDTLVLKGVPPTSGWHFRFITPCCRPNLENLGGGASGSVVLKAILYPDRNSSNSYPCINSSPTFSAVPIIPKCRGFYITMNQSVEDKENDSVVYNWDRTFDSPINNPTPRQYTSGFNYNNPTPDQSFDSTNIPATIDKETGIINYAVYGGPRGGYLLVNRVDEYRDGQKISSVFRESPVFLLDCPPIDNTTPNNQPDFYFDNVKQNEYEIVVEAGEKIEFPVQAMDNDSGATGLPQEVTMFTSGNQFAIDFIDTANCSNPPCAVLKNNVPQYDSSRNRYQVSSANVVTTDFEWQTNCGHLNADGSQKTYYFYFSAKDDHCPIPQQVDTYVKVTVGAEGFIDAPKAACVGDFDSKHIFSWTAGSGLQTNFTKWYIYAANATNQLQLIDSIADFNTMYYEDPLGYEYYQVRTKSSCGSKSVIYKSQNVQIGYQENPMDISITEQNRLLAVNNQNADNFQWYDCNADTIITDSIRQSFTPQDSGSFAAIITKGYCVDTTNCVRIFPVDLSENNFQNNLHFYPNPSSGLVNFEFPLKQESLQVRIRNIHGQLVQEKQFVNQGNLQLQLKGKPGIYFIELENTKGERANVKVVKR